MKPTSQMATEYTVTVYHKQPVFGSFASASKHTASETDPTWLSTDVLKMIATELTWMLEEDR